MRSAITLVLSILLAVVFLASGGTKLAALPKVVETFNGFGYPLWFMYFTGVCELAGAVLVLFPRVAWIGAALLVCVMVGAIVTHLTHGQAVMAVVPLVLLLLAVAVGMLRRPRALPAVEA